MNLTPEEIHDLEEAIWLASEFIALRQGVYAYYSEKDAKERSSLFIRRLLALKNKISAEGLVEGNECPIAEETGNVFEQLGHSRG
jgi:hypothetical protein